MAIGTLTRKTQRQPAMPSRVVLAGEEAADDRTEHARGAEDGEEVALVLGPLARRHDVADDREREREEAAGADALDARGRPRATGIDQESVQSIEPTVKIEMAKMKSFLRP